MRVPISGIVTGFRIRQSGTPKDRSEYGFLDILQVGDKKFDSTLTHVVVDDVDQMRYLLTHYSDGQLRDINALVHQIQDGKDKVWLLIKIISFGDDCISIMPVPNDGSENIGTSDD